MEITVRRARTSDVRHIRRLIDTYTADRRLLSKATVALFERSTRAGLGKAFATPPAAPSDVIAALERRLSATNPPA